MKRISLFIADPQYERFHRVAQQRDRSVSELIRAALDAYLREHDPAGEATPTPARPPRRRK
jgi:metal-responsive CopG/Arc/MetJ family transcriptional regulator